ncbi:Uncharacterised protein [uncultured archaeon]|nr:Uncharacterised protein [uncultured archaeon]
MAVAKRPKGVIHEHEGIEIRPEGLVVRDPDLLSGLPADAKVTDVFGQMTPKQLGAFAKGVHRRMQDKGLSADEQKVLGQTLAAVSHHILEEHAGRFLTADGGIPKELREKRQKEILREQLDIRAKEADVLLQHWKNRSAGQLAVDSLRVETPVSHEERIRREEVWKNVTSPEALDRLVGATTFQPGGVDVLRRGRVDEWGSRTGGGDWSMTVKFDDANVTFSSKTNGYTISLADDAEHVYLVRKDGRVVRAGREVAESAKEASGFSRPGSVEEVTDDALCARLRGLSDQVAGGEGRLASLTVRRNLAGRQALTAKYQYGEDGRCKATYGYWRLSEVPGPEGSPPVQQWELDREKSTTADKAPLIRRTKTPVEADAAREVRNAAAPGAFGAVAAGLAVGVEGDEITRASHIRTRALGILNSDAVKNAQDETQADDFDAPKARKLGEAELSQSRWTLWQKIWGRKNDKIQMSGERQHVADAAWSQLSREEQTEITAGIRRQYPKLPSSQVEIEAKRLTLNFLQNMSQEKDITTASTNADVGRRERAELLREQQRQQAPQRQQPPPQTLPEQRIDAPPLELLRDDSTEEIRPPRRPVGQVLTGFFRGLFRRRSESMDNLAPLPPDQSHVIDSMPHESDDPNVNARKQPVSDDTPAIKPPRRRFWEGWLRGHSQQEDGDEAERKAA